MLEHYIAITETIVWVLHKYGNLKALSKSAIVSYVLSLSVGTVNLKSIVFIQKWE